MTLAREDDEHAFPDAKRVTAVLLMIVMTIAVLSVPATLAWAMSAIGLTLSGRGTRPRYVASTFERACRWPMIAARCLGIAVNLRLGDWTDLGMEVLLLALSLAYLSVHAGDDDDFWTGRGRRIKHWITRALRPTRRRVAISAA